MRLTLGAAMVQLALIRRDLNYVFPLVTAPFTTVVLMMIVRTGGRGDLSGDALVAAALIALWSLALIVSGDIIESDRVYGVLELLAAAPSRLGTIVFARVATATAVSLVALAEIWLVAWLGLDVVVFPTHPLAFAAALLATAFATAGTAVVLAAVFVHVRGARVFRNSITYPFYVLGGVMVPVALLPGWIRPLSSLVFLSWSAELLRQSLDQGPIAGIALRLGMIVLLGAVGLLAGVMLVERLLSTARRQGSLVLW